MNTQGLLDQLLKSGQELLQKGGQSAAGGQLGGLLGSVGGGALGGGLVSLLLGSKKARKIGGKALTYGGLAALGVVAYKAYSNWQQQQGGAQAEVRTVDRLPPPQVEQHSHGILLALVAAAKADGHIDARERQLIDAELGRLAGDPNLRDWLARELDKPLDPAEVARAARTPEMAAEMYLASLLLVDEEHFMERAYLDELARQLQLPAGLKSELELQARG